MKPAKKRRTLRDEVRALRRSQTNLAIAIADVALRRTSPPPGLPVPAATLERIAELLDVLAHPAHAISDRKDPVPFVQIFTMQRGYYHALGALDAAGQLWERHQTVDKAAKVVTDEWWEPMPVERRDKP